MYIIILFNFQLRIFLNHIKINRIYFIELELIYRQLNAFFISSAVIIDLMGNFHYRGIRKYFCCAVGEKMTGQ